jgi:hypothetical protein
MRDTIAKKNKPDKLYTRVFILLECYSSYYTIKPPQKPSIFNNISLKFQRLEDATEILYFASTESRQ